MATAAIAIEKSNRKPKAEKPEPTTLGSRDLAKRMKMEPRALRIILRAMKKGVGAGANYSWTEKEAVVMCERIKTHIAEAEKKIADAKAAEKKSDDK